MMLNAMEAIFWDKVKVWETIERAADDQRGARGRLDFMINKLKDYGLQDHGQT